jgi:DNA-binding MarR family transcriptional regulator
MEAQFGFLISQIKQISDRTFDKILARKNISAFNGAQGRILYVLWNNENITLKELSGKTGLAPTTLTSMVDRMEQSGLIFRCADKSDRRKTILRLNDNAKELENDYNAVSEEIKRIHYKGFSETEIETLETALKKILNNLETYKQ